MALLASRTSPVTGEDGVAAIVEVVGAATGTEVGGGRGANVDTGNDVGGERGT